MECYQKNINGRSIQIADYPGEKGTIIAVHGLTGNYMQMHYYAESLKDYRIVSIDVRGRGQSADADEDTSIWKHALDVEALIKELNIDQPILMGYSMGAFICSIVASRLQSEVRGLILLDGAATCTPHQKKIVEPSLARLSKAYESEQAYLDEIKQIYQNLGVPWDDHMQNVGLYEIHQIGEKWRNHASEGKIKTDFDSFYTFDPKEIFKEVTCPVFLVHAEGGIGAMDPLFHAEDYVDTMVYAKRIEKITTPCNHYTLVFTSRPEIYNGIKAFLRNIDATS
ncbi:alpha/beta fold hydrolase [Cytobacillus kochii]|uniref:alpha/beta fold hydrolase n=1 Tax=Cytobacillus kochii TaxID=859143 RepID=UPI00402AA591